MDVDPCPGTDNVFNSKAPKERILEMLDLLEINVEKFRKGASQLEEDKDALLSTLDSVINAELMCNREESDRDDVARYADRIISRCLTVEVKVLTQRDRMQEEALFQVNHLIDNLVISLKTDTDIARSKCISYMNACSSNTVQGIT